MTTKIAVSLPDVVTGDPDDLAALDPALRLVTL